MSQSKSTLPQTSGDDSRTDENVETPEPVDDRAAQGRRSAPLALVFALLALGISIGLAVGGYFIWNQFQRLTGEQAGIAPRLEQKVQPLQAGLQAMRDDWQAGYRETTQKLAALSEAQGATDKRLNRLAALVERSERGWTLAEVEYLLRIANESLQLRRDRLTAAAALKGADARLRELADPQLLPVREQLARELNALREVPDVDVEGIALRLADSLQQVERLPVSGSHYTPPQAETKRPDATQTAHSWKDLPRVIWSAITELFRIREHDKPVGPLLPPDRAWFLKENLRLQLAAARLALLREDPQAYRQALVTSSAWLKQWFDTEDPAVTAMAGELDRLAAVDIHPALPDISRALQVLRELRSQQERLAEPADTPAVPATEKSDSQGDGNEPASQQAPAAAEEAAP